MKYAADTTVSTEKSQAEIRRILTKYGATKFGYLEEEQRAAIMFEIHGRRIRFVLPLPSRTADEFIYTAHRNSWNRRTRSIDSQHKAYEQAIRQRWRALTIAIKAKLEAVETGIATFEEEFMAYVLLPSGQTVGEWMTPQIEASYASGRMPPLMLTAGGHDGITDWILSKNGAAVYSYRQSGRNPIKINDARIIAAYLIEHQEGSWNWALEQAKRGRKIRASWWAKGNYAWWEDGRMYPEMAVAARYIEATDWEVEEGA